MGIDILSPRQANLLEMLMNPDNLKKSVTDICVMAEISRKTYYNDFKDPIFLKALEKARENLLSSAVLPVIHKMKEAALGKSFNDRKLLLEMAGAHTPKLSLDGKFDHTIIFKSKEDVENV